MRRLYNILFAASLTLVVLACVKPEDPDTSALIYGDWIASKLFINNEYEPNPPVSTTDYYSLSLDFNGSYTYVERSGRISVGTWGLRETGNGKELDLSGHSGEVMTFLVVSLKTDELHLVRNITNSSIGALEIRYIMRRGSVEF